MRPRKTPSRLESHRLKYNQLGRKGPLLRLEDLTKYEKDLIYGEVLQDIRVKRASFDDASNVEEDARVFDEVEMEVFAEWGVICHHPAYFYSKQGNSCPVCRCLVFPARGPRRKAALDK